MKKNFLGKTGIEVTQLCFGALPIGPLQVGMSVEDAAPVIRYCLDQGVNFIDTAQGYKTYPHIRKALEGFSGDVVIASKSHSPTYEGMKEAVEEARRELNRDVIDVFHLHSARADEKVFTEKAGALSCLVDEKVRGNIKAIGISVHSTSAARAAALQPEIDVVFPLINLLGVGIVHGTRAEMEEAIALASANSKGIYLMKSLAGGHLVDRFEEAFTYACGLPGVASVAVGMLTLREAEADVAWFDGRVISEELRKNVGKAHKKLFVSEWQCIGCGACEKACANGAIKIIEEKAKPNHERCILCGYCVPHCPKFALRLV